MDNKLLMKGIWYDKLEDVVAVRSVEKSALLSICLLITRS